MSKFKGRTVIEVEGSPEFAREIAFHLQNALQRVVPNFPNVHGCSVTYDDETGFVNMELTLEAEDSDRLDEVAAEVLDRGLAVFNEQDPEESDDLTVMESALTPA